MQRNATKTLQRVALKRNTKFAYKIKKYAHKRVHIKQLLFHDLIGDDFYMLSILERGKELDVKQTQKNVRRFFEKELPIIMARAHTSYIDLKSSLIDDMPKAKNNDNTTETKLTVYMQSRIWLNKILEAMQAVPEQPRTFLQYRYLQGLQWLEIEQRTGYGRRRGAQLVNQGFIYFANAFIDTYDYRAWMK